MCNFLPSFFSLNIVLFFPLKGLFVKKQVAIYFYRRDRFDLGKNMGDQLVKSSNQGR
jgi:hypothetical protein